MGRTCSTYEVEERCIWIFVGKHEGRRPLARPKVVGRIILKLIFGKWDGGMYWIYLARNRDRRRAVVNAVMNDRVS
jgi:hypothetical protein